MSCDVEVVIERSANLMGRYMGIYEGDTSYTIGLHCQYYSESYLLKAMTYYKCDKARGLAYYYYNDNNKRNHIIWYDTDGELVKMITNGVNGTRWKQSL
jgi:hypothetical protein